MSSENAGGFGPPEHFAGPDGPLSFRRAGSGLPLVLLHSLALSGEMWSGVVEDFSTTHEVFALDLRGHGASGWSRKDFGVEELGDDVLALFDHLGLERAHLLGLSMGGSVALTLAGRAPERIDRLVLCDTTSWYGADAPTAWAARASQAASRPRYLQINFQVERWFSDEFRQHHPDVVSLVTGIFLRATPAAHAAACRALGAMDSRALLSAITAPTLVVCGRDDTATPPEMGETIVEGVPEAELLLAPAKHFAILESPRLRAAIVAHLHGERAAIDPTGLAPDCCAAHTRGRAAA